MSEFGLGSGFDCFWFVDGLDFGLGWVEVLAWDKGQTRVGVWMV